jgi:hypothetical protein
VRGLRLLDDRHGLDGVVPAPDLEADDVPRAVLDIDGEQQTTDIEMVDGEELDLAPSGSSKTFPPS